jgi:uncharacterized small protein (DUF1192 family)
MGLPGRPKGALNYATRELKHELQQFFSSPEYRASVKQRIINGGASAVEIYFLQLLYGKPKETIDVNLGVQHEDLSSLSTEEMLERVKVLQDELIEAKQLESMLPVEYRQPVLVVADLQMERPPSIPLRSDDQT